MERFYENDPDKKEHVFGSNNGDDNNNDDDDDDGYGDDNDDDDSDDEISIIDEQDIIEAMSLDLEKIKLNHSLLNKSIKIAKHSWFWRFKSPITKLKDIEFIYNKLMEITEDGDNKEED
jgi:hypothetical protein